MAVNLTIGSMGTQVRRVQELLNFVASAPRVPVRFGGTALTPLVVDGIFGAKTKARVIEFQTKAKLKADGIVGPASGSAMVSAAVGSMTLTRIASLTS
jgi:peptidoglycan hydrolase-like protein with peptidoglycan-binding domain